MLCQIVAIVNATPDSFSNDGHTDRESILQAIVAALEAGADVIDLGAESTRPGATPLTAEEEWARLEPVLPKAAAHIHARQRILSIDTRHPEVARHALRLGADWINDVSSFRDQEMVEAVRHSECRLVVMHSLTVPADPAQTLAADADIIELLSDWITTRAQELTNAGIARERLIFDPGLGFGKTKKHSWEVLSRISELTSLGLPLLVGHSRKSFLSMLGETPAAARDGLTLGLSAHLMAQGVSYLRVHDASRHVTLRHLLQSRGKAE